MPERHHDFGSRRVGLQEIDDLSAQNRRRIARQGRDPFGVEKDHPRPRDLLGGTVRAAQLHDEEIALVVEGVLGVLEAGECLPAHVLEQGKMLLPPFEGLFHRDHAVPEHARLAHEVLFVLPGGRLSRSRARCRGKSRGR